MIGFVNACKTFKNKIYILKCLMRLVCQNLRMYKNQIQQPYLSSIMKLIISTGGFFDRTIFIPGQSRENEFVRELLLDLILSNFYYIQRKKIKKICSNNLHLFYKTFPKKIENFFMISAAIKQSDLTVPKSTAPQNQEENIVINISAINQEKPIILSIRQNAEIKNFRTRRHSGSNGSKKE